MPEVSTFVLDTKVLDELARTLDKRTERVLAMAAFEMETTAKFYVASWPAVDTMAMNNSIGVAGEGGDAEKAAAQAARDNPDAIITPLPKPEKGAFHIGPQVHYAPYVEYGTYKMGARPFVYPAFEYVRKVYSDAEVWKREFLKDLK